MIERNDLPLGFSLALGQNPKAMKVFADMPESRQNEVLQKAHNVNSKDEMQALVSNLADQIPEN